MASVTLYDLCGSKVARDSAKVHRPEEIDKSFRRVLELRVKRNVAFAAK
jgi:hypothetical protein